MDHGDPGAHADHGTGAAPITLPAPREPSELARMRWLLEAAPDAMVVVDGDGRIVMANSELDRLFGYRAGELVGSSIELLVPERHRAAHPGRRAQYARHPRTRPMGDDAGLTARRRDGTEFAAEISLSSMLTESGPLVTAAVRDVSLRRRGEERFRQYVESAPDAMVVVDAEGRMVLVNAQAEAIFGYDREELLGRPVEMLVPPERRDRHPAYRAAFVRAPRLRGMGHPGLELEGLRRDGSRFPIEISLSPLETEDGLLVSSAIRDVTERRAADEARFRLAAIVESSQDAIIGLDLDTTVQSWNRGAEQVFGWTAAEAVGRPLGSLTVPEHADQLKEVLDKLSRGERVEHREGVGARKDGTPVELSFRLSPVRDLRGTLVGTSVVARDVGDQKRAQAELARARDAAELASRELEAFSYSVAHDLKAPLRALDGFSQILVEDYADALDDDGRAYLRRLRGSAQYMARLIDSLLDLARVSRVEPRFRPVDLGGIARACTQRLRDAEPDRRVELVVEDGLLAHGDPALLAVAMDNLIGNAWKFTRDRDDARIEVGRGAPEEPDAFRVTDNGAGFDMAYAAKLFGVFQRLHTEREFEGTGIGLATVDRIVRRHGGRVWARGEVGGGATFWFTLPGGTA